MIFSRYDIKKSRLRKALTFFIYHFYFIPFLSYLLFIFYCILIPSVVLTIVILPFSLSPVSSIILYFNIISSFLSSFFLNSNPYYIILPPCLPSVLFSLSSWLYFFHSFYSVSFLILPNLFLLISSFLPSFLLPFL